MPHNQVKIVSNAQKKTLMFYIKNESQEWRLVSNDSVLSRAEYTQTSIEDRAEDIVHIINSVYNPGNRGVDILFDGEGKAFLFLKKAIDTGFSQSNLTCVMQNVRIAVAGKAGAGKSTLIERFWAFQNKTFRCCEMDGLPAYTNAGKTTIWYEIPGIDFGAERLDHAKTAFEKLAASGVPSFTFLYCLGTSKIEAFEEELILYARNKYPEIKILVVLTKYIEDDPAPYVEQLSKDLGGIKVIPVLAMDLKTRGGVVPAYGLDDIDRYLFEGK